jgi:hypothetical protein
MGKRIPAMHLIFGFEKGIKWAELWGLQEQGVLQPFP